LHDYTMPRMNGRQVLEMLRSLNSNVRVVFSSGHTQESDTEELLNAGARAFVAKPYRPENLVTKIREVLDEPAAECNGHASKA
jgi:CheY-like chemotaxis protein